LPDFHEDPINLKGWLVMFLRFTLILIVSMMLAVPYGSSALAASTDIDMAAIDRYVQGEMDDSRIPGVAIAIVEGNQLVYARGYGSAGAGHDVTPQTPFPIGSLVKSFTAVAVMQLVEAGRVSLDAPVTAYIPCSR
jgi:CubicO group peptidase (beta-lactamase class C family)